MNIVSSLAVLLLLLSIFLIPIFIIRYAIKPELINKKRATKPPLSRSKIIGNGLLILLAAVLIFGGIVGATAPDNSHSDANSLVNEEDEKRRLEQERAEQERIEASKPKTQQETKSFSIDFEIIEQEDSSIPLGETRTATEGAPGEQTITYEVTYENGEETNRVELKTETTKQPVAKLILVGSYVAPPPPPAPVPGPPASGDGYINSQGNHVRSPSSDPAGATAKCRDGTYSYSQNRRGTCSHHGGVAVWL